MAATSIDLSQIKTDSLDSKATFRTLIEAEGVVETIVAGTGITIDDTDPANPVVTATGGSVSLDNLREYFPTIANNATDAEHDLDIGAARIWVSDGTDERLVDFTAQVKRIDASWAAGTNQGGLDTGTVANSTWYYVWAIYNPTTDAAGYLLSASPTSPTMPSGYDYKVRIGEVVTNSSGSIRAFVQNGDKFSFLDFPAWDLNTTSPSVSPSNLVTVSAPRYSTTVEVLFILQRTSTASTGYVNHVAATGGAYQINSVSANFTTFVFYPVCDSSGRIQCWADSSSGWTFFLLAAKGWRSIRGG
jgi:hypothetical protein